MGMLRRLAPLVGLVSALAVSTGASAQFKPNGAVTIVAPFAPGGTVDQVARELARGLEKKWSVPVLVENKPGAGNILAATAIARSRPDGQKLLFASTSISVNPAIYKSLPYDTGKDLAPVSYLAASPNVLVVRPDMRIKTLKELIDLARTKSPSLQYASVGRGSAHHFCMELLQIETGVKMTHVPYKGVSPALAAVLGDEVGVYCSDLPGAMEPIREGKLIPLAVTSRKRVAVLPDVPTMAEAGVPNYAMSGYVGIMAPGATARPVREAINRDIQDVIGEPAFRKRFADLGYDMTGGTVDAFGGFLKQDIDRYADIAKTARIEKQ